MAQLVAHLHGMQGVRGSNPLSSTGGRDRTGVPSGCDDRRTARGAVRKVPAVTVRPIVIYGEPVLHHPARVVTAFDGLLARLETDLVDTMRVANGVGLAANQIGVDLRVYVFDCPEHRDDPDARVVHGTVVNPVLELTPRKEWERDPDPDDEGCLSVPGEAFPVARSPWARVTGVDVRGRPVVFEGRDLLARCLQHETDHLDGRVYLDRVARRDSRQARRAVRDNGWGVSGLAWTPGVDPDPFGHDEHDTDPDAGGTAGATDGSASTGSL